MEKMDSLMIDSEDGGLGLSYGSQKFKRGLSEERKDPMEVIYQIQ
jgi:hypothetical protein